MDQASYNPYWPEHVMFVGAGATAQLGFSTTEQLGQRLQVLMDDALSISERIDKVYDQFPLDARKDLSALFSFFEAEGDEKEDAKTTLNLSGKRARELDRIYDFNALKLVVKRSPLKGGILSIQDVFNLIDMSLESNEGMVVDGVFLRPEQMRPARNVLVFLVSLQHKLEYDRNRHEKSEVFEQYYALAKELTELMLEEGSNRSMEHALDQRDFYLFSYAVISMNWDPMFLWFLFNAHRETNHDTSGISVGKKPEKLKLFHDLAHFMGVRAIDQTTPSVWYPMNETAVQRLNDEDHQTGRRVRIGKFYFPHGSHGFRECPHCGKLTFFLGSEWRYNSDSLFPPSLVPSLAYADQARSKEEADAYADGVYDALQCTYCGAITEAHHTSIVMQTNYKQNHPSYINEIQRDMNVAISKAKHIILFGYSLPDDDIHYRSVLAAKRRFLEDEPVTCSIINFDSDAPKGWLQGEALTDYIRDNETSNGAMIAKRVIELFGIEHVRCHLEGIPNVFMENDQVDANKVRALFEF